MNFFKLFSSIAICILAAGTNCYGQLPTFSNFWLIPQLTAPTAMAGNDVYQVAAHFRRQSFKQDIGYRTLLLSGQLPLYYDGNRHFGTLGFNIMREESGSSYLFATSGAMLTYLYDAEVSERHHLVGGIQGGYYSRNIDISNVTTDNQFKDGVFDPALDNGEQLSDGRSAAFLANVGLAYYLTDEAGDQLFHIGAALANANNGSFNYLTNTGSRAAPNALIAYSHVRLVGNQYYQVVSDLYWRNENKINDIAGGVQFRKGTKPRVDVTNNHLGIGLYYSQDQTGIMALQLVQPNWLLALSYDMVLGDKSLRTMQNAVEVTLGWRAVRSGKNSNQNPRKNRKRLPWKN